MNHSSEDANPAPGGHRGGPGGDARSPQRASESTKVPATEPTTETPRQAVEKLLGETQPLPAPIKTAPQRFDVAVVGAGAAGLTAAMRAAEAGSRVVLLNAHPKVGLKILMSGGTRCNVTHEAVTERDFNGGSRHVIARILRAFDVPATLAWFEQLGVDLKLEDSGKYFPVTDDAQTVLDALMDACGKAGVEIQHGARVVRLERAGVFGDVDEMKRLEGLGTAPAGTVIEQAEVGGVTIPVEQPVVDPGEDGWRLGIQNVADVTAFASGEVARHGGEVWPLPQAAPDRWVAARRVVLACGGLSFPRTGSDGTGYALATSLGHTLVPPLPALTPLVAGDALCRVVQGLTLPAELTLWSGTRRRVSVRGSLLVTHFGYSGPAALDLSRHWLRAEGEGARRVTASFAPGVTRDAETEAWLDAVRNAPERTARRHLARRVPERLAERLCEEAGVDPGTAMPQIAREARARLLDALLARDLHVKGTLGYEKAEVTAGGVSLAEVDASTLESRKAPGVFLCGEMLDVEGRLGGFNFQWSWSSGTVAGRSAASS
jgi:predicted flavoprotein YhiN